MAGEMGALDSFPYLLQAQFFSYWGNHVKERLMSESPWMISDLGVEKLVCLALLLVYTFERLNLFALFF